ncbi:MULTISPECIES: hypothetical protein [Yersinia pseudotuberculosis complex]|nr:MULTISPECIES: hypothetical protein [Yersinia pseudotuberculosis complex]BET62235.1 hypothetical protein YPSE1_16940 [Yersinia pseudotuberculosis]
MAYEQFVQVIMPSVFCPEDSKWIQEMLLKLNTSQRQKVAIQYADVYQEAFDNEPVSYRQENRARHEANSRLRVRADRHSRSGVGYAEAPPLAAQGRFSNATAQTPDQRRG